MQASGRQSITVEDSMSMVHASSGKLKPASLCFAPNRLLWRHGESDPEDNPRGLDALGLRITTAFAI